MIYKALKNRPDLFQILDQINSNFLSKEGEEKKINFQENKQPEEPAQVNLSVVKQPEIIHQPITLHGDKYSAPAPSQHWALIFDGENTPWLDTPRRKHDINFNPQFMQWQGERWRKKFEKPDIYAAIADFRSCLINAPDKIPGRWEEYEGHFGHRLQANIASHEAGIKISESETRLLVTHAKAVNPSKSQLVLDNVDAPKLLEPSAPPSLAVLTSTHNHESYESTLPPVNKEVPSEFWEKIKQIGKPMPKATVQPKETELDRLNRLITEPLLRNQVMAHVMASDKYEVDFDEEGTPYQVREIEVLKNA